MPLIVQMAHNIFLIKGLVLKLPQKTMNFILRAKLALLLRILGVPQENINFTIETTLKQFKVQMKGCMYLQLILK